MYTRGRGRSVTSTEWGCRRWYRAGDDVVVWERNTDGTPYGMATYRCLVDHESTAHRRPYRGSATIPRYWDCLSFDLSRPHAQRY